MNNDERVFEMMSEMRKMRIPNSKVEKDLKFSNGLLYKGGLSEDKFEALTKYYSNLFTEGDLVKFSIYKLINPIDNSIFYIGFTKQNLSLRLGGHVSDANTRYSLNEKKEEIISHIINLGHYPSIESLEEITGNIFYEVYKKAIEAERKHIISHFVEGHPISNKIPKEILEMYRPKKILNWSDRACEHCGLIFSPTKPKQIYCKNSCRVKRNRIKKVTIEESPKEVESYKKYDVTCNNTESVPIPVAVLSKMSSDCPHKDKQKRKDWIGQAKLKWIENFKNIK